MAKPILVCCVLSFVCSYVFSQENSPFSRYGVGDIYPQQSIASRGMGGLTAAVADPQFINTSNPASYGYLNLVTYDFGLSIDARTLHSASPVDKYNSTNFLPSYIQLGIPVSKKGAALLFGLRPDARINYSVEQGGKVGYDSIGVTDSLHTLFAGNGGLYQAYIGLAKRWNHISIGFNAGYEWGNKYTSTRIDFPADSSFQNWYRSNSTDTLHYNGVFLNPGVMVGFKLAKHINTVTKNVETYYLNLGASGTLEQDLNALRTTTRQTFAYGSDGQIIPIDSVSKLIDVKGKINIPLTYTAGFVLNKNVGNGVFEVSKWTIGADYTSTKWTAYRYYGSPDRLINNSILRIGASLSPNPLAGKSIFSQGTYRIGFYTGKDYINADGNGYKVHAFTLGYSFNLRKFRSFDNQFTKINTAIEFGKRGSNANNITENFFKFSLGLSLSDIWFIKRKYD